MTKSEAINAAKKTSKRQPEITFFVVYNDDYAEYVVCNPQAYSRFYEERDFVAAVAGGCVVEGGR